MKITSVKTLLAVLFGVAVLIFEGITFNGQVQNLLWMILLAYLCVRGLIVAFSEKAYEEEQQSVYQGQALYLDLFGKFGYVLPDAPFVLFLLVYILAVLLPATSVLLVIWLVLWAVALIGAIWLRWYVSREERRRKERGEWGAAVMSEAEEQTWKRVGRWRTILYCVIIGVGILLGILYKSPAYL